MPRRALAGLSLLAALSCARGSRAGAVSSPSRVHTVSGVVFMSGALITIAAVAIPLWVCQSSRQTDSTGYTTVRENPCNDLSNGTKAAWIAGAGVGLTLAVFGGIVYFETEPKPSNVARWTVVPWAAQRTEGRSLAGAGLSFVSSF